MYSFFKPRIKNNQVIVNINSSIELDLIRQIDGVKTWEDIFGELMITGYSTNEINRAIISLIEKE